MSAAEQALGGERVVIDPTQYLNGSAMQQAGGEVRDLKLIYPETGFDALSLCLGVVEFDPGHHTPLHRHRCEEVYYVVSGTGELESGGRRHSIGPGSARLEPPRGPSPCLQHRVGGAQAHRRGRDHACPAAPALANAFSLRGPRRHHGA